MKEIFSVLLLLPLTAWAIPQPWMKTSDPNNLLVVLKPSADCPDDSETYGTIIESVLIRSRIEPEIRDFAFVAVTNDDGKIINYATYNIALDEKPFLMVSLWCTAHGSNYLVSVMVHFAVLRNTRVILLHYEPAWNSYGLSSAEHIRSMLKTNVEYAVTDYLKANFGLGEDEK